jgi:pantoate--beta-alanine ligase
MTADLDWYEIAGVPTVREADGLALSSATGCLAEARTVARCAPRALAAAAAAVAAGAPRPA